MRWLVHILLRWVLSAILIASCTPADQNAASAAADVTLLPSATHTLPTHTPVDTATLTPEASATPTEAQTATPAATLTALPAVPHPLLVTPQAPVYSYRVVNIYPHQADAFTQGLLYLDETLYESTGLRGKSTLRQVDLGSGEVLHMRDVPVPGEVLCDGNTAYTACLNPTMIGQHLFAEGLAAADDRLYQLTWQSHIGLIYDRETFELLDTFAIPGEGWGLTYDGEQLILSDGTSQLTFLDPVTLQLTGMVTVHDGEVPIKLLNELEVIDGEVWANVWKTERIARIDPVSGAVTGWVALDGLLAQAAAATDPGGRVDVLNGIAHDPDTGRLFVTGKWWPLLFEIEVIPGD
jgi:glutamine cyclotransferase